MNEHRHRHEWVEHEDGTATCAALGCQLWLPTPLPEGRSRPEYMSELHKEYLRTSFVRESCGDSHHCGRMVHCYLTKGHRGKHQGNPDMGGRWLYEWKQNDEFGPYTRRAPKVLEPLDKPRPRRRLWAQTVA